MISERERGRRRERKAVTHLPTRNPNILFLFLSLPPPPPPQVGFPNITMYLFIFISPCHLENGYYPVDFIPSCGNDWFDYRAIEKPVIRIRGLLSHCCFKLIKLKSFHLFCHCAFLTASLVYVSRNSWMDNNSNDNSNNYDGDNNNRKKVSRTVEALGQLSRTEWDSCVGGNSSPGGGQPAG